jgi:hypothetical protein
MEWVIGFTSRPHNPGGKYSRYLLNTGMSRHLRMYERFGKEKYLAPTRIQATIPQLSSLQQTLYPLSYLAPAVKYFQNASFTILHDIGLGCSFIADTSPLLWSYPHHSYNRTLQPEIVNPRVLLNNDHIQLCFKSRKAISMVWASRNVGATEGGTTRKITQISFKYVVAEMKHVAWRAGSHASISSINTLRARNEIQAHEFWYYVYPIRLMRFLILEDVEGKGVWKEHIGEYY